MAASAAGGIYSAGTAFLQVVPSFRDVEDAMKGELRKMGARLDAQTEAGIRQGMAKGASSASATGKKAADDFTGAFNRDVQRNLDKAVKNVGDRTATTFDKTWNAAFNKVGQDLKDLQKERIGFSIDENTFNKSVENMRNRVRTLEQSAPSGQAFYDARATGQDLDKVLGTMEEARRRGQEQGAAYAGAFETQMKQGLDRSIASIKPVPVDAFTGDAEAKIQKLREDLEKLGNARIGIDVSAEEAHAEIKRIERELRELDRDGVNVRVRVDAREAADGLKKVSQNANESSNEITNMEKAASLTMSRLQYLIALGASLGSVFVPAAAAAAGAIGFIATSAAAAGAGVGVFALGMYGVSDALQAMQKNEDSQAKSTNSIDQANRRVSGSTDAVANAVRALGNTRRQVAQGEADAARSVADAERDVERARHDASIAARDAARSTADAQRDLIRAEQDAKDVRLALNDAIKKAKEDLVDLRVEMDRNSQDQSKAVTAQMRALDQLHALQANPRASEVELREARDNVNEQTVRLEELAKKRREMQKQQQDQATKGVEGDTKVIAARKKIKDADEKVADARVRLQRAEQDGTEKRLSAAQKVQDAQRRVGVAELQQRRQRIDGQYQIASAEAAVTAAARTQQGALEKAGVAGGAALDNLNTAMGKLTPTQQRFVRFIFGLKDELQGLRAAAADPMLPGIQKAIEMLLPYLPGVSRFIGNIAYELGQMAIKAATALKGPLWQRFFSYIDTTAVPTLKLWETITGNVIDGLLNLYLALTPLDGQVGRGLVKLSEDFSKWAAALGKSKGYQEFLEYVRENGPRVLHFLGELGLLGLDILKAYAPIGELMLKFLTIMVDGINSIPTPVLTVLVGVISTLALGISGLGAVIRAQKFKEQLGQIFGDSSRAAVQKYAIDTGRATAETGKFRTAISTVAGAVKNVGDKYDAIPGKVGAAFSEKHQKLIQKYAIDTGFAASNASKFEKNMGLAAGMVQSSVKSFSTGGAAVGKLKGAFSSFSSFLGGPWGLALIGASVAIGYFTSQSEKQKARVEALEGVLGQLSDKYTELSKTGEAGGNAAKQAFADIVRTNPDMKQAVVTLDGLGISFDQMMQSLNSGDPSAVVNALNGEMQRLDDEMRTPGNFFDIFDNEKRKDRIDELQAMKDAFLHNAQAMGLGAKAEAILNAADERNAAITKIKNAHQKEGIGVIQQLIGQYDAYTTKIDHANAFISAFSGTSTDATSKAQALRDMIDDQTKSMQDAQTAADNYQTKLLDLRDAVKQNGSAIKDNSREAINNRNAVKEAALAARDMYIQDAAAGKPMSQVTAEHKKRIDALFKETGHGNLNRAAVQKLVDTYGKVPKNVETALATKNFTGVYKEMQKMRFMQYMLEQGKSADEAEAGWKAELQASARAVMLGGSGGMAIPGKATGGPIEGPGTTTSDSVIIRASRDEHMLTADEVAKAGGHEAVYKLRGMLKAGLRLEDLLPGFATGGAIARRAKASWPYQVNTKFAKVPTEAEIEASMMERLGGSPLGTQAGGAGWRWQQAVLHAAFKNSRVTSSTGGGHAKNSWHYKGRAIDIVPHSREIMKWIHDTYGATTLELIGPYNDLDLWHGAPHSYSAALQRQHQNHIHWAYDQGGMLQPGAQQVVNMTGKPEPVLTQPQWAAVDRQNDIMQQLVAQANQVGSGAGNTYQFEFKDTTLDAAWIRAQQQREDALARVSRAR